MKAAMPQLGEWRFNETNTVSKVRDQMSKHAMHATASERVRVAGEMCVISRDANTGELVPTIPNAALGMVDEPAAFRQLAGIDVSRNLTPVLVLDNNSGTFAPPIEAVERFAAILRTWIDGLDVVVLDYKDSELMLELQTGVVR